MAVIALILAVGILIAEKIPRAPHVLSDWPPQPLQFVKSMLGMGSPIYSSLFDTIDRSFPMPISLLIGMIYLLLAVSGWMPVAYFFGLLWRDQRQPALERAIPLSFIAAFLIVALAIPATKRGDPFDMQHRQFVLLYGILAVWSGSYVGSLAVIQLGQHAPHAVLVAAALLLPVPFLLCGTVQTQCCHGRRPMLVSCSLLDSLTPRTFFAPIRPRAMLSGRAAPIIVAPSPLSSSAPPISHWTVIIARSRRQPRHPLKERHLDRCRSEC